MPGGGECTEVTVQSVAALAFTSYPPDTHTHAHARTWLVDTWHSFLRYEGGYSPLATAPQHAARQCTLCDPHTDLLITKCRQFVQASLFHRSLRTIQNSLWTASMSRAGGTVTDMISSILKRVVVGGHEVHTGIGANRPLCSNIIAEKQLNWVSHQSWRQRDNPEWFRKWGKSIQIISVNTCYDSPVCYWQTDRQTLQSKRMQAAITL
jgi:hypothetical protein